MTALVVPAGYADRPRYRLLPALDWRGLLAAALAAPRYLRRTREARR